MTDDFDPAALSEGQYVGIGPYDRWVKRHDTSIHGDAVLVLTDGGGTAEYTYNYPHLRQLYDDGTLTIGDPQGHTH